MSNNETDPEKRPFDNAAMQLRLNAFTPRHSPQLLVACCFFVAILFIPTGTAVVLASDKVFEVEVRYDQLNKYQYGDGAATSVAFNGTTHSQGVQTTVGFTLKKTLSPPIYMYYRIKGFYQNYREYSQSRSDSQSRGDGADAGDMANCKPLLHPGTFASPKPSGSFSVGVENSTYGSSVYNPCGVIAWSKFNDSISLRSSSGPSFCEGGSFDSEGNNILGTPQFCEKKGIALSVDVKKRYKVPSLNEHQWTGTPTSSSDPFRAAGFYYGEVGHSVPNTTDEDYIVWARTAALPDFRKLYRKITTTLAKGSYEFVIAEHFPTHEFEGEKSVILATTSWIGGKNYVLGGLLIAFGALSLVLALAFFLISIIRKPASQQW